MVIEGILEKHLKEIIWVRARGRGETAHTYVGRVVECDAHLIKLKPYFEYYPEEWMNTDHLPAKINHIEGHAKIWCYENKSIYLGRGNVIKLGIFNR
jgi:hypothetical protein